MTEISENLRLLLKVQMGTQVHLALAGDRVALAALTESLVIAIEPIIASVHENARRLGHLQGAVEALQEVMLERTDDEEPFVASLLETYSAKLAEVADE